MASNGIRLTDIYGYSATDYNNYIKENDEKLNLAIQKYPNADKDQFGEEMYLNNLILNKVGKDEYDANVKGLGFEKKKDYYNNLFADQINKERIDRTKGKLFVDGDLAPFKYGTQGMTMNEYFKLGISNKEEENNEIPTLDLKDSNDKKIDTAKLIAEKEKTETAVNIFDRLYSNKYQRVSEAMMDSPSTEKDIDSYSKEIRKELDSDKDFTYDFFKTFDEAMRGISNYYTNYHDTDLLPITPNEMKDIMAKYYAINSIKGNDAANVFAQKTFQDMAHNNLGIWDKIFNGLSQAGANFTGNLISLAGIIKNSYNGLKKAMSKNPDYEVDDLNFFNEWLLYSADNDITRYGNDCIETGTWIPSVQEERKKTGHNPYRVIRRYDDEGKFFGNFFEDTIFELPPQIAFTAAGMLSGTAIASFLRGTIGKIANKASRAALKKATTSAAINSSKWIERLSGAGMVGATSLINASAEASIDAFQVYDDVMSGNLGKINDMVKAAVDEDIENGKFREYLYSKHPLKLPKEGQYLSQADIDRLNQEYEYYSEIEYNNYLKEKRDELLANDDVKDMLKTAATRNAAKTMFDETMIIGLGDALFTKVLGGSFKQMKAKIRRANGRYGNLKYYRNGDNALRVNPVTRNFLSRNVIPIASGLREAAWEGVEELLQNVETQLRLDLAGDYATKWIENRHDTEALADLSDSFWHNFKAASESIKSNVLSDESQMSFWMGFISSGIGSPTIINGIKSSAAAKQAGIKRNWKEVVSSYIRNPLVEAKHDFKIQNLKDIQEAEDINKWLENHDDVAKMQDYNSLLTWIQQQTDSSIKDNEVDFRDAIMGQKVATLMMMDRIGGSAKELTFSKKLREMAKTTYGSDTADELIRQAIINQGLNGENITEEQRKDILNDIVSKAKDLVDLQNKVHATRGYIFTKFGEVLSPESIDAWTYETLMHEDLKNRVNSINKTVADEWNKNVGQNDSVASTTFSKEDNILAKYGSINEANIRLSNLKGELVASKKLKSEFIQSIGKAAYKNYVNSIKDDISEITDDILTLEKIDQNRVITAEQIVGLSPEARAAILNDKNTSKYNKEQQAQIKRFKSNVGMTTDILKDINDAATIQKKYDTYTKRFNSFENDIESAIEYDMDIRRRALIKFAENGLKDVIAAESKDEFRTKLDEFISDPKNESLIPIIPQVLKNNKFYNDYKIEEKRRENSLEIMRKSPIFAALSKKQQDALGRAFYLSQIDDNVSFENVFNNLNSKQVKDLYQLTDDDVQDENFASKIRDILQGIDNYQKAVNGLQKQVKDLNGNGVKPVDSPVIKKKTYESKKTLSQSVYDAHRDEVNSLVNNMASYLNGKTKKTKLSKDDYFTLMKLIGGEEFTNDFLVDDIIPSLDEFDIKKNDESLNTAMSNAMYNDPESINDVKFKNTKSLDKALGKLDDLYNTGRLLSSDKKGSINDFLASAFIELNPAFTSVTKPKNAKPQKLQTLGKFSILSQSGVETEAEAKYYIDNNIEKNLETLAKININRSAKDPITTVFIYDSNLAKSILAETGEEQFSSDNLPLIAAVVVNNSVDGAKNIDGMSVLPIGLVNKSRKSPVLDPVNSLNALRQIALSMDESGIVKNTDKTIYKSLGLNIKFSQNPQGTASSQTSIRDILMEKHNQDREAAFNDFQRGIVKVELELGDNRMVTGTYVYNGKPYKIGPYPAREGTFQNGKKTQPLNAYVDENNPASPYFLFSRDLKNEDVLPGITLFELLSNDTNLSNIKHDREDIENISRAIREISTKLPVNIRSIVVKGKNDEFDSIVNNGIDKSNLNLARKYQQEKAPIQIKFIYKDGDIVSIIESPFFDNVEAAHLKINHNSASETDIYKFAKETIKNLIFDDSGNIRMNPATNETLVKIQVKDPDARDSKNTAYQRRVFFTGLYTANKVSDDIKISELSVNETNQNVKVDTGNIFEDSKANLLKYKKIGDGSSQRDPDAIHVTEFIRGKRLKLVKDLPIKDAIATNLGTSIDKLIRVYFQTGQSIDGIKKWMLDNNLATWPGIGSEGNDEFVRTIEKISNLAKFFESRDEVPITDELILNDVITASNGKQNKITGTPDIITINKRTGKYSIYDMKSFKYSVGAMSTAPGVNNTHSVFRGLSNLESKMDKWTKQLSLYKVMLEHLLGEGCVSKLCVIPISLNYNVPSGTTVGPKMITQIGDEVTEMKVPYKDNMIQLHISNENTTIYNDVISITPIEDVTTISPELWKQDSTENNTEDNTNNNEEVTIQEVIPLQNPVTRKNINEVSDNDLLSDLGLLDGDDPLLSELDNINECG